MKQNYITKMPDKAGAFLKASRIIAKYGGNIIRVNYNKSIDLHTLFIDVSAEKEQIEMITNELSDIGYLCCNDVEKKVILISLNLKDQPGQIVPVLEILTQYKINIEYMNSQENGCGYQQFKMGLYIDNIDIAKRVLDELSCVCNITMIDYDVTEKTLDNTVFYIDFGNKIRELLSLSQTETNEFIINSNKILQLLDDRNEPYYKTFEYIYKFADFVQNYKGDNYCARTESKKINDDVMLHIVEPPCGSNTYILEGKDELLFVDSGFACYKEELLSECRKLIADFDKYKKSLILTHADIDHSGLAYLFNKVYVSQSCYENFDLQHKDKEDFRELNANHNPYSRLSKIISKYKSPELNRLEIIGKKNTDEPLSLTGKFTFKNIEFCIYEGFGGHVKGETILLCDKYKIAFTGDNVVNIKGFSKAQKQFNTLAPYLMSGVDIDSNKAIIIRNEVFKLCKGYLICPGHGSWFSNIC